MKMERTSGVLLHPSSLPGKYGIGSFGKEAYDFIDFLIQSGQKLWQILPLGPTGYGDSPYSSFSAFAGNPLLISLELLVEQGLLKQKEIDTGFLENRTDIDFGKLITWKFPVLKKAFKRFSETTSTLQARKMDNFRKDHSEWLENYCLFMALKDQNHLKPWFSWNTEQMIFQRETPRKLKEELRESIEFHTFLQFTFFNQWQDLKNYANRNDVKIIGDMPLYVAHDSADAWANPEYFLYDKSRNPKLVAGVPPDYFAATGQLWGNPIYNWDVMKEDGFSWWKRRLKFNLKSYDIIRLDHFRGLSEYWGVPFGEETAINGNWYKAPGKELLQALTGELGDLPIIAEDLGIITQDVIDLRDEPGLPGMRILQFAFDSGEGSGDLFLPHNYIRNSVVYTGTHDNDTLWGWFSQAKNQDKQYAMDYLNIPENMDIQTNRKMNPELTWAFIRAAWASTANYAIIPLQDLLGLGNQSRMNLPGTTSGNWKWRYDAEALTDELAGKLAEMTRLYQR